MEIFGWPDRFEDLFWTDKKKCFKAFKCIHNAPKNEKIWSLFKMQYSTVSSFGLK